MNNIIVKSFGRICLFGEHSDWASEFRLFDGCAIALPIDQGFIAQVQKSNTFNFITSLGNYEAENLDELLICSQNLINPFRYCCGTICYLKKFFPWISGLKLQTIKEDLPIKCGLSSSAAICILVVKAMDKLYNLNLSTKQIMNFSFQGEITARSYCGRMDQIGVFPKGIYKMFFSKEGDLNIQSLDISNDFYFFYVNLEGNKNTLKILDDLRNSYPHSSNLRKYLGHNNIQIIKMAERFISAGDIKGLGLLLSESQLQFDNLVSNLSSALLAPKFHELQNDKELQNYIYGGKEIGSHGDGTALFIAKSRYDIDRAISYIQKKYGYNCEKIIINGGRQNA